MVMNASGPISLGGSTAGQSINLEVLKSGTSTVSLNDEDVRYLANILAGEIATSNFYGRSYFLFGQEEYTSAGTYQWVCPETVTSVSVICIGAGGGGDAGSDLIGVGGGGGGGALAYRNSIPVVPGNTYEIIVGQGGLGQSTVNNVTEQNALAGGDSSAFSCVAGGGSAGDRSSSNTSVILRAQFASGGLGSGIYDGYRQGGAGGNIDTTSIGFRGPGGGGAGGYTGNGGAGARGRSSTPSSVSNGLAGSTGQGGSGGGGGASFRSDTLRQAFGGRGGGVGIYGPGDSGTAGLGGSSSTGNGEAGGAGSLVLGLFNDAGGGGGGGIGGSNRYGQPGADGAVRIIWPGQVRRFPGTGTTNA